MYGDFWGGMAQASGESRTPFIKALPGAVAIFLLRFIGARNPQPGAQVGTPQFMFDFEVVRSNHPEFSPGSQVTAPVSLKFRDSALNDCKAIMVPISGITDPAQVKTQLDPYWSQIMAEITTPQNRYRGRLVLCSAVGSGKWTKKEPRREIPNCTWTVGTEQSPVPAPVPGSATPQAPAAPAWQQAPQGPPGFAPPQTPAAPPPGFGPPPGVAPPPGFPGAPPQGAPPGFAPPGAPWTQGPGMTPQPTGPWQPPTPPAAVAAPPFPGMPQGGAPPGFGPPQAPPFPGAAPPQGTPYGTAPAFVSDEQLRQAGLQRLPNGQIIRVGP